MGIRRKTLSNIEPIMSQDIYQIYKEYRTKKKVPKKAHINNIKNLRRLMNLIFEEIRNTMLDSDSGVCIDKVGYFFIFRSPKKVIYTMHQGEEEEYLKYGKHSGKREIVPLYIPYYNVGNRTLQSWSMDYTFTYETCRLLDKKIREGKKYKCYPHTLKRLKRI